MKRFLLGTLIMGLFALVPGSRAETGGVVVHINQNFIAGGKAFSAGTYKVYQGSPQADQWLILRSKETGALVYLLPSTHDEAFPGQFGVKLRRAGNVYYLSEVVTELGVYTLPAPHALTQTAKKKNHDTMAMRSGSN